MRLPGTTALPLALVCLLAAAPLTARAAQEPPSHAERRVPAKTAGAPKDVAALPEEPVRTRGSVTLETGERLDYAAEAGTLPLGVEAPKPLGRIFYVAYTAEKREAGRPVTFVFNGGPGASSAYLHLGAMGPRRLVLRADGTPPPPPARLAENPLTWLAFTDLVFVDPIGTGFSRAEEGNGKKGADGEAKFWNTENDLRSLASFIRLYLTRADRWGSPKFLAGESYGGFRVAALSQMLASKTGVGLSGAILISPLLEFSLFEGDAFRILPWALLLPSYAAAAHRHGLAPAAPPEEVERFALGDYLSGLARGDALGGGAAGSLYEREARYTGLPEEAVRRVRGRIGRGAFAKELLRGKGRVLGLYDASIDAPDPHPESPLLRGNDPSLDALTAPFTAAFNRYVRETLGLKTDLPYELLNRRVSRRWEWRKGRHDGQGFAGAAEDLKEAMTLDPALKVLIVHGRYDLVTPYLGSVYAVRQMALDESVRANLTLRVYEAGHMVYTKEKARERLYKDARAFYAATAGSAKR